MALQHVIELNNHAATLMKHGLFRDAIVAASSALKHHGELVHSHEVRSKWNCESDWIDKCMMYSDVTESSTGDFLYQRGIHLPSDFGDSTGIAPILIFNLALSHQLLALRHYNTIPHQQLLLKAKKLYELAHECEDSEDNVLFKFAIINNTALIHKTLGNDKVSKECLDFLMSLIMLFVDRGCSAHLQHIEGFLANISTVTETAPAA